VQLACSEIPQERTFWGRKIAIERITVIRAGIEERAGSLHRFLSELSAADIDLQCAAAFSSGGGLADVFLSARNPQVLKAWAKKA